MVNEKVNNFYKNMYLLKAEDRKILYEQFNDIFQKDKKEPENCYVQTKEIKEVFKNVLLYISKEDNGNNLLNALKNEYYIHSVDDYFIPFNEGGEDLVYSYLIIAIFNTFFLKKSIPKSDKKTISYRNIV